MRPSPRRWAATTDIAHPSASPPLPMPSPANDQPPAPMPAWPPLEERHRQAELEITLAADAQGLLPRDRRDEILAALAPAQPPA